MRTCNFKNCTSRAFMDTDRCFDHQFSLTTGKKAASIGGLALWALVCLAGVAFAVWVIFELVMWVTSK